MDTVVGNTDLPISFSQNQPNKFVSFNKNWLWIDFMTQRKNAKYMPGRWQSKTISMSATSNVPGITMTDT